MDLNIDGKPIVEITWAELPMFTGPFDPEVSSIEYCGNQ